MRYAEASDFGWARRLTEAMRRRSRGNYAATYAEVSVWAILGCKAFSLAYAMSHASRLAARGTR